MPMDKANLSLGKSKRVCGYEIKKMPLGAYLKTLERIKDLPYEFLKTCFPGQSLQQVLEKLIGIDENGIKDLAFGAFISAPKYVIGLLSELTGIDEERLVNDEAIGADGFVSIAAAFIEVNSLGKCIAEARGLKQMLKTFV